jgi:hypothetical protein
MNSRTRLLAALTLLLGLVAARTASAQSAQIEGTVKDETGAVLPGATVTATNQETGLSRSATAGSDGSYRIAALPPAPYTLQCEISGFQALTLTDIVLTIQQTVVQNLVLKVAQIEETVTVTGESPIIDTHRSDVATAVSAQQIQDLPVATRRWIDLALLVPGTSQDNIRGFFYRGNVNIGAGTREYSNAFIVDGVNNTWAEMGEARQNFPMDSIQEFKVSTSNFKAEYGLATGGMLAIVSKSGTNQFQGSGFLFFRDGALNAKTYFEQEKPDYRRYQYGGTIGGPIVRDKTHFFFAYERTDETNFFTVTTGGVHPEYDGTFPRDEWRYTYTAKVDHQFSDRSTLFARLSQENEYRPDLTAGGIAAEGAGFDFAVPRLSFVVGHTWLRSDRAINDFRFQRGFSKYEVSPAYTHAGFDAGDFTQARLDNCQLMIRRPTLSLENCNDQMGPETRWQFKDDFTYFVPDWGGDHQFKFGLDYNYVQFPADILNNYSGTYTFATDRDYNPNDPTTFPIQYTQTNPRYADLPVHHISFYAQDDWKVLPGLTLNLGLRYDAQPGVFNEDITDIEFPLPIPFYENADRLGDWNNFGPRLGFAWDVKNDGETVVKGGYGLFYDNIRTLLQMLNERVWHQAQTIIIANPSYPDPFQGRSREEFLSTAPPNIEVTDVDFINPYAHQYNIGVSRMLGEDLALSADFTYVRRYGDIDTININYPVGGVRPYAQFGRVDSQGSTQENEYTGFYFKAEKRLSDRYQFLASYSLAKADDFTYLPVGQFDDLTEPGFQQHWFAAAADRRHRFVLSGIVQLPWEVQLSAIGDFRSPLPFIVHSGTDINRDTYANDLPPGVSYRSGCRDLNLTAVNAYRTAIGQASVSEDDIDCPTFANVDMRLSKLFPMGTGQRLEVIVQMINLFNRANFNVANGNLRSAQFGRVNDILPNINGPARQIELALRYSF